MKKRIQFIALCILGLPILLAFFILAAVSGSLGWYREACLFGTDMLLTQGCLVIIAGWIDGYPYK